MTVHNVLFYTHTLCMNYVIKTFLLLVPQSEVNNNCFFAHDQGQKPRTKTYNNNFAGFHNHSPLLTMAHAMKMNICMLIGYNSLDNSQLKLLNLWSVDFHLVT